MNKNTSPLCTCVFQLTKILCSVFCQVLYLKNVKNPQSPKKLHFLFMPWMDRTQAVKAYTIITFLFFFSSILGFSLWKHYLYGLWSPSPFMQTVVARWIAPQGCPGTYLASGRRTNNLATPHRKYLNLTPLASPNNNLASSQPDLLFFFEDKHIFLTRYFMDEMAWPS